MKMKVRGNWNLEQLIKFHLEQNNVLHLVKEFPYIMYSVRNINGTTRWASGKYSSELGYYIKYQSEYDKSNYYKDEFEKSELTIDEFYKDLYDNLPIPEIGIGVGGYDYNTTYDAVLKALKIGYRLIDTAENYHNEEAVGNAIIDSGIDRKKIIIITKYFGGTNYGNQNDVINSFNNSLKKLKTNYIDIYLIHKPFGCRWENEWEPIDDNKFINYKNRLSVWLQLIELKKLNLVKYIGVSNWTLDNINEIKLNNLYIPDIIQIEWCPSFYDNKLYDFCIDNSIKIIGYGLFSRNSINEIQYIVLNEKNKNPSEILIRWCLQKKIIVIPRTNNFEKLLNNFNTSKEKWTLCDEDVIAIDNTVQTFKGHCLKNVYEKNYSINLWKPLILENSQLDNRLFDDKINDLINGNISCIIVNNIITNNDCIAILKKMEDKNLLKNESPYDNYGINFRGNEIGITVDNILWRDNPEKYFDECIKVNNLFETIFDDNLNPFEIMFETIKKIVGDKYIIERMKNNSNIESPKGLFRILSNCNNAFPYHTDGFNYGKVINSYSNLNREYYSVMSEKINTNSIIGVILKLQEPDSIYEVNLYNCLVDDLENYKDNLGMYSHWMGTKYNNIKLLETILDEKPYYTPLLKSGSIYFFSASRIHKIDSFLTSKNRIVLSTFMCVSNNKITVYQ
jgi:diketogulonate reductase-like aldo/keto reductase